MIDGSDLQQFRTVEIYLADETIKTDIESVTFHEESILIEHADGVEVVLQHAIERYKLLE